MCDTSLFKNHVPSDAELLYHKLRELSNTTKSLEEEGEEEKSLKCSSTSSSTTNTSSSLSSSNESTNANSSESSSLKFKSANDCCENEMIALSEKQVVLTETPMPTIASRTVKTPTLSVKLKTLITPIVKRCNDFNNNITSSANRVLTLDVNTDDDIDIQLDQLNPLMLDMADTATATTTPPSRLKLIDDDDEASIEDILRFKEQDEAAAAIAKKKLRFKFARKSDIYNLRHNKESQASKLNEVKITFQTSVDSKSSLHRVEKKNYVIIILLLIVNLLNFIDRFSIAGVLTQIQKYFDIDDTQAGLLQTLFICSYMLLAPLFGYLGDRYNRKYIIIFGILFWSLMTLLGSFVPSNYFWAFAIIRSLVGVGEASYSCIAPTIIGDLFTGEMRTRMLALFYIAVPVGSGLGYIVGSFITNAFNDWRWALRFTPPLGLLSIVLLMFLVDEPKRGGAEGSITIQAKTSFMSDVKYCLKHKSFMWVTMGFTFGSFVMGGLSFWVPTFVEYAIYANNKKPQQIPLLFGVVTVISGLLGVGLAIIIAPRLRKKGVRSDPILCGIGSLIAVPCLYLAILLPRMINLYLLFLIMAVGITAMCLCWTLVSDILLYTIQPERRSMASAMNILICHALGDAVSPYILGAISDAVRKGLPDTYSNRFNGLQSALYASTFFAALSFGAYFGAALFVKQDKDTVEAYIKKQKKAYADLNGNAQRLDESEDIESSVRGSTPPHTVPVIINHPSGSSGGFTNLNFNHSNSNTRANLQQEQQQHEILNLP